jgi:hypothetical protein
MSPITHFLTGWVVANSAQLNRRDRILVTLAGIVPDLDGLGIVAEIATENTSNFLPWWSQYHHVLCHNLGFGLMITVTVFLAAVRRWTSALLSLLSMADSLSTAVFKPLAMGLGRPVDLKCLAEYHVYRFVARSHFLPGMEAGLFSPGNDFKKSGRRRRRYPAAKIRTTSNLKCLSRNTAERILID